MVRSELHQLEELISEFLNGGQSRTKPVAAAKHAAFLRALAAQCALLKRKWVQNLFSAVKETVLLRYIHYHQAGVTGLANRVTRAASNHGIIADLYAAVSSELAALVDFLKENFYAYFDKDHPVMLGRWASHTNEIMGLLAEVKNALPPVEADRSPIIALEAGIKAKLQEGHHTPLSYRQLENYTAMLESILLQHRGNAPLTTVVTFQELYRHNFNSYYFGRWYQHQQNTILSNLSAEQQAVHIRKEISLLEGIYVEPGNQFDPELPPVNSQLLAWLESLLPKADHHNIVSVNGHERMPLQFSVAQFAFFIRLCYLEGCFQVQNISAILRFCTHHFETKKQLHISVKSFARAFYGADQATAAVVRDFLQRMINVINKTYFPKS